MTTFAGVSRGERWWAAAAHVARGGEGYTRRPAPVAQGIERAPPERKVAGSIPAWRIAIADPSSPSARIGEDRPVQCALREVRDEDLAVLFDQWADPVAARMAAFTPPDHMDRDAFERCWARIRANESGIARAIVVDGEVAGTISSWGDPDERELTYWIGRSHWGKGIATCALDAFLALDATRPLHARAASDNVASRRVLEKCGFRVIATGRG